MTRSLSIAGFGAAALLVAACGGTNAPPLASTSSSSSSDSSTSSSTEVMSTNASCTPAGTTVKVTAKNTLFDASCLAAPAGKAFTIVFDNEDPLLHNVAIYSADPNVDLKAKTLFQGATFTGPKTMNYSVPALSPGTYHFHCDVHPTQMFGTFVVK